VDVQAVLAGLNSPVRREILWLLWDRELPAGEIASAFEVTAPTISSHLAVLRAAELVTMRADGNFRRYRARRDTLRSVQSLLASETTKWIPEPAPAEPGAIHHDEGHAARIGIEVPTTVDDAFGAFTDAARFGGWLGVPVHLHEGRFATTLEWGTRVRGSLLAHRGLGLIVFRWDFEDDAIPLPGDTLTGFADFVATEQGTRIEVTQVVATREQAEFMHIAWGYVLGRYAASVT
jgi:DNA-binding transcriptional ArsR family regulator